jgi:hypothetical protein
MSGDNEIDLRVLNAIQNVSEPLDNIEAMVRRHVPSITEAAVREAAIRLVEDGSASLEYIDDDANAARVGLKDWQPDWRPDQVWLETTDRGRARWDDWKPERLR